MKRLESTLTLKKEIESVKIAQSINFLNSKQSVLERFEDIEDLVFQVDLDHPPAELRGFEYHFQQVRAALASALWIRGVFIGLSVLDDLLFAGFRRKPPSDAIAHALTIIKDNDVHKPGFILYPIHSLGINGAGFFEFFTKSRVQLAIRSAGILLRAQTNSLDGSLAFLDAAREEFGVSKRVSRGAMEHYHRSRPTRWLTRNPLLAVKVRMFSGSYYENQQFLVIKLQAATSLLFLMAALQRGYAPRKAAEWGSTRRVNNNQTLDIHHYFVFERPVRGSNLNTKCVPMNVRPAELTDLSALPIDLSPKLWSKRLDVISELAAFLSLVERQYVSLRILSNKRGGNAIAYGKIFTALHYFRRSFKSRGDASEQVVNLAVAFEVLLTPKYERGVGERFDRRIKLALQGIKGSRRMRAATQDLYKARSETVHNGIPSFEYNLPSGQEAFVYVFLGVLRRVANVTDSATDPIGEILGD
jgi:hypothetical protein